MSCIGVIKGIHPSISDNSVKASLRREGADITLASRIENYRGKTFCIKLTFNGNSKPLTVSYNGFDKMIHPFIPPSSTLLCHKCGRGGHRIVDCNARTKRCPICSEEHERKECTNKAESERKCPNCQQNHTANYHKCPYLIREKAIVKIRLYDNLPRNQAINIWEERERQIVQNLNPTVPPSNLGNNPVTINSQSGTNLVPNQNRNAWNISAPNINNPVTNLATSHPATVTNNV